MSETREARLGGPAPTGDRGEAGEWAGAVVRGLGAAVVRGVGDAGGRAVGDVGGRAVGDAGGRAVGDVGGLMTVDSRRVLEAGQGRLVVGARGGRASVETIAARSPLRLLAPRNHGEDAWIFTSTFGGGLVDGDVVGLEVHVREGAGVLLATQASTKVYRSRVGCTQRLEARVDNGASLVVLPDPVVCYADARYAQASRISLARGGSLLWVDGLTCGRAARGERWQFSRYETRTRIDRAGVALARDAVVLDPAHGGVAARMGRWEALYTLIAIGPRFAAIAADALTAEAGRRVTARRTAVDPGDVLEVTSPLACAEGAIVRIAATSVERATRALRARLARLPALLGDDPFARKW